LPLFLSLALLENVIYLCYNTDMKNKTRKGQAMLEYVLVFAALLGLVLVSGYLLSATKQTVFRSERLVGSDYP
jgi:hypothetical protein